MLRRKLMLIAAAAAALVAAGCTSSKPTPPPDKPTPVTDAASPAELTPTVAVAQPSLPAPPTDPVAAQKLTPDQVLNRAPFPGGTVGTRTFHGGEVLLWQTEPNRFTLRANLDLGNGNWDSASNTTELVVGPDRSFIASMTLVNDVEPDERLVPVYAFYGLAGRPEISQVEVQLPGTPWLTASVRNGTWLVLYQGVPAGTGEIPIIAYGDGHRELARQTLKLPQ